MICSIAPIFVLYLVYWLQGGNFDRGPALAFCTLLGIMLGVFFYAYPIWLETK